MKTIIKKLLSVITAVVIGVLSAVFCVSAAKPEMSTMPSEQEIITTVGILGIMNGDYYGDLHLDDYVTRAEFTKITLCTSSLKDSVNSSGQISPFSDVLPSHWASGYIITAVSNNYLRGYVDGTFRPDKYVTLEEAATVMLRVLGYSGLDSGKYPDAQLAKYTELNMNNGISALRGQALTRRECMYLAYNVLCTETSTGQTQCQTLGYTTDSNGRIDYLALISSNMEGPVTVNADGSYTDRIGIEYARARFYRDGKPVAAQALEVYDQVYYNRDIRTVWAYSDKTMGLVNSVCVAGISSVSPDYSGAAAGGDSNSIIVNGTAYKLGNDEVSRKFATDGSIKCDDFVMLMLDKDGNVGDAVIADRAMFERYITDREDKTAIMDSSLKGPYTVMDTQNMGLPFDVSAASVYVDGKNASASDIQKYDIYYYSVPFYSVWVYRDSESGIVNAVNTGGVVTKSDNYNGTVPAGNDTIIVSGNTYSLGTEEVKYKFSGYGSISPDDFVLLLLDRNGNVADAVMLEGDILGYIDEDDRADVIDSTVKGPYTVTDPASVSREVPFDIAKADIYYGTKKIAASDIKEYDIYYYSEPFSTLWIYRDTAIGMVDSVNASGVITNSANYDGVSATPGGIVLGGRNYTLGNSTVTNKLTPYGPFSADDFVMLLLDKNGNVADIVEADSGILEKFLDENDDRVALIDSTLKGPYVLQQGETFGDKIPFGLDNAKLYLGTKAVTKDKIKTNDVYYYSVPFESVWVYRDTATGFVNSISPSREAPTAVTVGTKVYTLEGASAKQQFSNFGLYEQDDFVTLLLGKGGTAVYATEGDILEYVNNNDEGVTFADLAAQSMKGPVVVKPGSDWEAKIPFDVSDAVFYRKNSEAQKSDIRDRDVLYYSKALSTVWIYSDKATGVFESVLPNRISPSSVVVSGKTYTLESTGASFALSNLGSFKYGDTVTLLLGKDGGVVDVISGSENAESIYGFITSFGTGTYTRPNGTTYTAENITVMATDTQTYTYEYEDDYFTKGDFVSVTYIDGKVNITKIKGGVTSSQATNINNLIMAGSFADDAVLLDVYVTTDLDSIDNKTVAYKTMYPSRLSGVKLEAGDIYYAKTENGQITELILKDFTGDIHTYGILTAERGTSADNLKYSMITDSGKTVIRVNTSNGKPAIGAARFILRNDTYRVTNLEGAEVAKEDFMRGYSISDGKTYNYASDVQFYIKNGVRDFEPTTYDDIISGDYRITVYYDDIRSAGGLVRIIVAE